MRILSDYCCWACFVGSHRLTVEVWCCLADRVLVILFYSSVFHLYLFEYVPFCNPTGRFLFLISLRYLHLAYFMSFVYTVVRADDVSNQLSNLSHGEGSPRLCREASKSVLTEPILGTCSVCDCDKMVSLCPLHYRREICCEKRAQLALANRIGDLESTKIDRFDTSTWLF